jgi:hypothetical protein
MAIMTPQALQEMQNRFPRGRSPRSSCPALNEEVLLADNKWILAKDLKIGDEVATHLGSNKVTHIDVLKDRAKKEVVFSDNDQEESIVTSDSHPYYVQNEEGFVEVKDLKVGDQVGNFKVKEIKDAGKGSVAHISIDEAQTYFLKAGDEAVLSHNKTLRPDKRPTTPSRPLIKIPKDEFGRQGKPSSFSNLEISDEALRLAERYNPKAMSGTPAQRQSALEMIQATLNAGEGEQGVQNLYANNIQAFKPPSGVGSLSLTPPTAQTGQAISSPTMSDEGAPFVSGATRIEAGLDPLSRQLLFGLDGRGGFIPGAFRAAERTFFTPEGEARVIPEEIAGLTPDQLRAMEIARQTGVQDPYLQQSRQAYERGLGALGQGFGRAEAEQRRAVQDVLGGVSQAEALRGRGLAGLTGALGEAGQIARGATGIFGAGLRDPESLLRGTLGGYDPRMTEQFYDPFEERVVQQTIRDVLERGEQADIAARAADIGRGGESAFGSRARLMAGERERALGRGLGEAISGIRSAGFQRAQQAGMGEFGRQLEARRQAASGLAGLAGQRLGAQQTLGQTLAGLGSTQQQALSQAGQQALGAQQTLAGARSGLAGLQQQMAAQQQAAQFGAGQALAGLGTQAQMAQQADISQLLGVGAQQQQQQQAVLDAQRRAALQAQQAPLAQYQSLLPFVQAVPAGQQQVTTTFAPPPSPLQAGLGVGLSTLGALGQFMNQPQQQQFNPATRTI